MDRSRRAAIGRALRAREQGAPDPAFLSLTEDEQENGLALFGAEGAGAREPHQAFERAPAHVEAAVRPDRAVRHARPPALPEPGNVLVWQVPVLAAMLAAAVAVFAVWSATTSSDRPPERVEAAHDVVLTAAEPIPIPIPTPSPAPSDDRPVPEAVSAPEDVTPAVVRDTARVRIEAPRPRMDAPVRATSVSASRSVEPPPIPEPTIAPSLAGEARPVAVVAAAAPAAPARVESSAPAVRPPAPEALIQGVLSRYRNAYEGLDAGAAREVWPSVDHKALSKAFERLEQQQVVFDACAIAVTEARAVASCRGVASYVPRVGNKARRDDQRQWEFTLSRVDDAWRIDSVFAR